MVTALRPAIRQALPTDQSQIANLMYFENRVHRHLDWRTPLDWLGAPEYWVLEEQGNLYAAFACPPDPETAAWIRLFAVSSSVSLLQAWNILWDTARSILQGRNLTVAAIVMQRWMEELLLETGFREFQKVVVLAQNNTPFPWQPNSHDLYIREMTQEDLPSVAALDAAAFSPLWQNSLASLKYAFPLSEISTVGILNDEIVAYQMSTRNPFGAHLARLAVHPQHQGRGFGYLMVQHLLQNTRAQGLARLTVNTQSDNTASLALYEKIGFRRTGEQYAVLTYSI
ncbi:MAG: hypothetical protein DDG60_07375 [Anaerolineae bacterium]|nr:MAG: hypothetical protein DDG60_07375 [Anaerolineae bacterium]